MPCRKAAPILPRGLGHWENTLKRHVILTQLFAALRVNCTTTSLLTAPGQKSVTFTSFRMTFKEEGSMVNLHSIDSRMRGDSKSRDDCDAPHASASLQKRLIRVISPMEPAAALAIRGSATTTARHWARETATLIRLRSKMKASPREPYSP